MLLFIGGEDEDVCGDECGEETVVECRVGFCRNADSGVG